MPYIPEDEKDQQNEDPSSVQLSGASPTTDSEGTQAPQNSGNKGKGLVTGSGYQNLDKYLAANAGQNFGNQLVGKVSNDVNQTGAHIGEASSQISNQIKDASKVPTADDVNAAIANPSGSNPTQYQGWENQTYQGPKNITGDNYNNLYTGVSDATNKAQYLGTEPGRFTLLDSYFGTPGYTQGQKGLDNLLVQNQKGIGTQINAVQQQANQLNQSAQTAQNQLTNQASTAAENVQNSALNARNAIGVDASGNVITDPTAAGYGALGKNYTDINNAVASTNATRNSNYNNLLNDVTNRTVSDADLVALGLTGQNPELYNLDPTQYLSKGTDLGITQVMTPEQQSYIQALSQLAGVTDTFAANPLTAATPEDSFDTGRFLNDVNNTGAAYNNAYNSILNNLHNTKNFTNFDASSNPTDLIRAIQNSHPSNSPRGNNSALPVINQSLTDLNNLLSSYGIDPTTGKGKYLR